MKKKITTKIITIIAIFAAAGILVMLLWNSLIPQIIGWNTITYIQSLGILLLTRLLFGGMGGFGFRQRAAMKNLDQRQEDRKSVV